MGRSSSRYGAKLRERKEKPKPAIKVLQGKARHVSRISHTVGTTESLQTVHTTQFRVGKQPVVVAGTPNLGERDAVTLAGVEGNREFRAYAIRNDSTGVEYPGPTGLFGAASVLIFGLSLFAGGIALVPAPVFGAMLGFPLLLLGIVLFLVGIFLIARIRRNQQANQALRECPPLRLVSRAERSHGALESYESAIERTEPAGFLRTIAGFIVGIVGVGMTGAALLALIALLSDVLTKRELGVGGSVVILVLAIASGIGGLTVARWGFAKRRRPAESLPEIPRELIAPTRAVRKRVLQIASGHGGRVTAAEVAAALEIEQEPAERALEEAAEDGEATLLFSPDGVAVYEFSGLVTQKSEAKEPWDL